MMEAVRGIVGVVAVAVLGGWLAGCATVPDATRSRHDAEGRREIGEVLRVAFAGDSITAGCQTELTGGPDPCSWTAAVDAAPGIRVVGGWAQWGAPSSLIAQQVEPVDAEVLVVLAGTNDVFIGIPFDEQRESMDAIAAVVGAPDVVVLALPPISDLVEPAAVEGRNRQLRELAEARGWLWVDPWGEFVADDEPYEWVPGAAPDGVHPVEEVQAAVGQRIAAALTAEFAIG